LFEPVVMEGGGAKKRKLEVDEKGGGIADLCPYR
jgi:hypothetical protein